MKRKFIAISIVLTSCLGGQTFAQEKDQDAPRENTENIINIKPIVKSDIFKTLTLKEKEISENSPFPKSCPRVIRHKILSLCQPKDLMHLSISSKDSGQVVDKYIRYFLENNERASPFFEGDMSCWLLLKSYRLEPQKTPNYSVEYLKTFPRNRKFTQWTMDTESYLSGKGVLSQKTASLFLDTLKGKIKKNISNINNKKPCDIEGFLNILRIFPIHTLKDIHESDEASNARGLLNNQFHYDSAKNAPYTTLFRWVDVLVELTPIAQRLSYCQMGVNVATKLLDKEKNTNSKAEIFQYLMSYLSQCIYFSEFYSDLAEEAGHTMSGYKKSNIEKWTQKAIEMHRSASVFYQANQIDSKDLFGKCEYKTIL